jgi:hypothetical protein
MARTAHSRGIVLVSVALLIPVTTEAQVSSGEACPERVLIPGGSSAEDRTVHRCNLDNTPMFPASLDALPGLCMFVCMLRSPDPVDDPKTVHEIRGEIPDPYWSSENFGRITWRC